MMRQPAIKEHFRITFAPVTKILKNELI